MLTPNAFPYTFTEHHKEIDTDRCRYSPEAEPKWSREGSPEVPPPSIDFYTGFRMSLAPLCSDLVCNRWLTENKNTIKWKQQDIKH